MLRATIKKHYGIELDVQMGHACEIDTSAQQYAPQ